MFKNLYNPIKGRVIETVLGKVIGRCSTLEMTNNNRWLTSSLHVDNPTACPPTRRYSAPPQPRWALWILLWNWNLVLPFTKGTTLWSFSPPVLVGDLREGTKGWVVWNVVSTSHIQDVGLQDPVAKQKQGTGIRCDLEAADGIYDLSPDLVVWTYFLVQKITLHNQHISTVPHHFLSHCQHWIKLHFSLVIPNNFTSS